MSEDTISSVLTLGDLEPLNIFDEETQQWVLNPVYDLDFSIVIDEPSTNHGIPEFDELIAYCKQMGRGMSSGEIKQFLIDESNKHNCNLSFNYVGVSHPLIRKLVIFILKYRHAELNQLNSKGNLMKTSKDNAMTTLTNNLLIINTTEQFWNNKLKRRLISVVEGQEVINLVSLLEFQMRHFNESFFMLDPTTKKWLLKHSNQLELRNPNKDDNPEVLEQRKVVSEILAKIGRSMRDTIEYINEYADQYKGDLTNLTLLEDELDIWLIESIMKLLQLLKEQGLKKDYGTSDKSEFITRKLGCRTQQLNAAGEWTFDYDKIDEPVNASPCKIGYNVDTGEYVIQFYTQNIFVSKIVYWLLPLIAYNDPVLTRVITIDKDTLSCTHKTNSDGLIRHDVTEAVCNYYLNVVNNIDSTEDTIADVDKYGISDELKSLCVTKPVDSVDHWFKVATDYPSAAKFISQLKVHYEEVNEGTTALKNLMELAGVETINELFTEEHINDERLETQWIELIDAFGDQMVTAIGSMRYLGVDPARVLSSIAASNLSKFEDDKPVRLEEHGKILKGKFYTKVDLVWVLTEMREHFKGWVYNETDKPLTLDNLLIETGSN